MRDVKSLTLKNEISSYFFTCSIFGFADLILLVPTGRLPMGKSKTIDSHTSRTFRKAS